MGVLSKDWNYQVIGEEKIVLFTGTPAIPAKPGYYVDEVFTGPNVLNSSPYPKPSIQTADAQSSSSHDFLKDTVHVGSGYIRYATWAEVCRLQAMSFVGTPWWNTATQAERDAKTAEALGKIITDSLSGGILGGPLLLLAGLYYWSYEYSSGGVWIQTKAYLSVWMDSAGNPGICTFWGYASSSNQPRKTVTYNNGVYI